MIPLIQKDVVEKRKWSSESELLDIIAISESTPGPISVNAATFVGYKVAGIIGGIVATISLAIPSFVIVLLISYFYETFITFAPMIALFKGLKAGVCVLLFIAVLKFYKNLKWNVLSIILFSITAIGLLLFAILNVSFSWISIIFIATGLISGLICIVFQNNCKKREKKKWLFFKFFQHFS